MTCSKCAVRPAAPGHRYCKECKAAAMRRSRRNNAISDEERKKDIARSKAGVYLRRGKIEKTPCADCGDPDVIMLIEDYDQPLEVIFLCRRHHRARRARMRTDVSV